MGQGTWKLGMLTHDSGTNASFWDGHAEMHSYNGYNFAVASQSLYKLHDYMRANPKLGNSTPWKK
jgi:prepilin-type processing-associated H-X9-DG protein